MNKILDYITPAERVGKKKDLWGWLAIICLVVITVTTT